MRPDFKDRPSTRRNRRRQSTTIKPEREYVFNGGNTLRRLWQKNWHIAGAAAVCLSIAGLSFWAIQKQEQPTENNITENTVDVNPIVSADTETPKTVTTTSKRVKRNNWTTLPLALPASEEEKFQQVLQSHNLVSRVGKPAEQAPAENQQYEIEKLIDWQEWTVKRGDNLAIMAKRNGVNPTEVHYLMQSGKAAKALKRIFPKQTIQVHASEAGEILELQYDIKDTERLVVKRNTDTSNGLFNTEIVDRPYDIQTAFAQGTIEDSLFLAGMKAGISDRLTMELAGIFGWDIDFVQDIRVGDKFSLLFEERYRDGERLSGSKSEGAILAAEFVNNGRTVRAIRYEMPDGRVDYFTPDGKSLRKAFIRNPVDFARISSKFNLKRKHPILNRIRAHKGVDYAAPTGTPIRSAGDGKVVFRGKKGGYGNTVIIQHGSRYSTLYAHMSKYARGSNQGKRVRQGQVIGYIGKSGLATGPHLHYEFRVNGVHRNPLTVKHPSVQPIPKKEMAKFKAATADIIAQLDLVGQSPQYAYNNQ